jgi:acetyl-CoA carboxylase biotin carboxyl carrier protein
MGDLMSFRLPAGGAPSARGAAAEGAGGGGGGGAWWCIIEAMKIMNEIEAEIAGVIREVLVEDAQPVEFGQTLFRVDPNG